VAILLQIVVIVVRGVNVAGGELGMLVVGY